LCSIFTGIATGGDGSTISSGAILLLTSAPATSAVSRAVSRCDQATAFVTMVVVVVCVRVERERERERGEREREDSVA
jgi:hypothetical protein